MNRIYLEELDVDSNQRNDLTEQFCRMTLFCRRGGEWCKYRELIVREEIVLTDV